MKLKPHIAAATALSILSIMFGAIGIVGSLIRFSALPICISIVAALCGAAALFQANQHKKPETFATTSLAIAFISIIISTIQYLVAADPSVTTNKISQESKQHQEFIQQMRLQDQIQLRNEELNEQRFQQQLLKQQEQDQKYQQRLREQQDGSARYQQQLRDQQYRNLDFQRNLWNRQDQGQRYQQDLREQQDRDIQYQQQLRRQQERR